MKLSAIFLSVNIAATIPLIASQMAMAGEEVKSDTSDWLKSSLVQVKKKPSAKLSAGPRKISLSDSSLSASDAAFNTYVARLKPIDRSKKLPSRRELELKLMAQTPVMAPTPQQTLTGQVSAYSENVSTYNQYRVAEPVARHAHKAVSAPESLRFAQDHAQPHAISQQAIAGQHRIGNVPSVKNMVHAAKSVLSQAVPTASHQSLESRMSDWLGEHKLQAGERVMSNSGALLVQAPVVAPPIMPQVPMLTDNELKLQMRQAAQVEMNEAASHSMDPSFVQHQDAGPPPFPLNMLPEASLKQFIRNGQHKRSLAPRAYFGSWHGGRTLPAARFRSNLSKRSNFSRYTANAVVKRPKNRYATPRTVNLSASNYNVEQRRPTTIARKPAQVKTASAKIATYAPYVSRYQGQTF